MKNENFVAIPLLISRKPSKIQIHENWNINQQGNPVVRKQNYCLINTIESNTRIIIKLIEYCLRIIFYVRFCFVTRMIRMYEHTNLLIATHYVGNNFYSFKSRKYMHTYTHIFTQIFENAKMCYSSSRMWIVILFLGCKYRHKNYIPLSALTFISGFTMVHKRNIIFIAIIIQEGHKVFICSWIYLDANDMDTRF